jgi:hypothetical protein
MGCLPASTQINYDAGAVGGDMLKTPLDSLAGSFLRTGWIGFWMQLAIGSIGVALTVYAFVIDRNAALGTRGWPALIQYLTLVSLLVLAFTTIWFYRYILLGRRIADPARCPPESVVRRTVGVGVAASTFGLVLSMLIMVFEVSHLFLYFLRAPKAGVPVIQANGQATWVSAGDILNLAVVVIFTFIEVLVLVLSLWLLFRVSSSSAEFPHPRKAE